ncbi:S-layer homology domain-containing protein, partial [Paenibacillus glucanolyticus]
TATGLTNETTYYFAVMASNESGYSGYSNEASATPQMPSPEAPTAPTGLTAKAGNEQVELSWSGMPGTVTYSVYGGTASGVYDSTPIATVDGSKTSYTATGLTNETTYYFAVMASNESGYSGYSNEASATPRTGSTPPNSSGGTPSTTNPPFNHNSINVPKTQNNIHVTINGQMQEGITTDAITTDNGLTVQSVTIDAAKLSEALAKEVDKPVIVIAVNSSADKVTVALTGEAVESLKNKQAIIEVHTPNGNYKLPATELGMDRFSAQLGDPVVLKDVLVHVDIAKSGIDKIRLLENTSKKGRFTVMFPPVDFTITASYKGKTVNLDKFTSYVEREIPLPEGVDPNKVTTAIVLEANGRVRHVPTNLTLRDGKYYSVASSMMNSTYSLIWHPMRFADVEGHWSQAAVNDMASRMVVNGVDATHYLPNAAITRAEFAAIIVRALGLTNNGVKSTFEDVKSGDWYAGAVATAQEYGITAGDEDGTFHPAETITREEAMVMIARAMKLAGLDTSLSVAEADAALSKFADRASVAIWAQQAVAATVKMGLVSGSDAGLQPKSDITRAETAVIVQRMLEKAGLIDNKHSE